MKPEAILKKLTKIEAETFIGLCEIYENQKVHEDHCATCKDQGLVLCPARPSESSKFSLEDKYTPGLIQWIISCNEPLEEFLEKKKAFGLSSVNLRQDPGLT